MLSQGICGVANVGNDSFHAIKVTTENKWKTIE